MGIKTEKTVQIVAELMDVLHRHGVDVNTPYVFENFFQDNGTSEVIGLILTDNQCQRCEMVKCSACDEYGKKPVEQRIARYSRLPKGE